MLTLSAISSRLRDDESGFTLIELLVSIALGMIVLLAVLNLVDSSGRASVRVVDKSETVQRARIAMDRITRSLRTQVCANVSTPPIISGSDSSVTFYSDTNSTTTFAPRKVTIAYASGAITQQTFIPTNTASPWTYPSTANSTRTLADNVAPASGTPLFTYYGWSALTTALTTPLSTDTITNPVPANSIAQVVNIAVTFRATAVSGRTSRGGATTQTSNVYTRNADFSGGSNTGRQWGPRCG